MENKPIFLRQSQKKRLLNRRPYYLINPSYKNKRFSSYDNNNIKNKTLNTFSDYYYKNPFFYNNDSLNTQLRVLKDLNNYKKISTTSTSPPTTTKFYTNHNTTTEFYTNNKNSKTLNNNYINNEIKRNYNKIMINKGMQYNFNFPNILSKKNKDKKDNNIKIEINDSGEDNDFHKDTNNKNVSFTNSIKNLKLNDEYFYKIIFKSKPIFKHERELIVDNKFNMIYAENEKLIEKEYNRLLSEGKKVKSKNNAPSIKQKLNETKSKIKFMKGIMDYTYPGFVLSKIKIMQKRLKENKPKINYSDSINGMEKRDKEIEERNQFRREYLLNSISLYK